MPLSAASFRARAASRANGRPLIGAGGAAPGDQTQPVELDGHIGAHERHRLPPRDRLAERLALLDVGDDVVHDGVAGAHCQCRPAQPGQCDGLGVVRVGRLILAQSGRQRDRHPGQLHLAQRRSPNSHAAVGP